MKKLFLFILLVSSVCWGQGFNAFQQTTFTSVATASALIENTVIGFHQLSWTVSGTVATCTVALDSSVDGTIWVAGNIIVGQTCTSNGNSSITAGTANWVRVNMTAISGAGATVVVTYKGWVQNPASGGGTVTNSGGALTADLPVFGAGAADIKVGTKTGNTNQLVSFAGATTASRCLHTDGSGNATIAAADCSSGTGTVTNTGGSLPSNAVVLGNTAPDIKADTGLSTDGAGATTDTQGTITTSKPLMSHTATWNAAGVAFTNWLSNITCTAAATASIAAGFGTAGTQWQFKYGAANCGAPQLLLPDGVAANPSIAFASDTQLGWFRGGAGILSFANGAGATIIRLANSGLWENSSAAGTIWNSAATNFGGSFDSGIFRAAAGVVEISNTSSANRLGLMLSGNSVFVASNFTTSGVGTALENITGLAWTFPATALNYNFHCHIGYSQAVGTAAVAFGIKASTNNPTNIFATGEMYTAAGTVTTGVLVTLATQTATNIVTGTPGGTGTNLPVDLHGTLELPASAVTINLMTSTATAADTVTVLRGSYCSLNP